MYVYKYVRMYNNVHSINIFFVFEFPEIYLIQNDYWQNPIHVQSIENSKRMAEEEVELIDIELVQVCFPESWYFNKHPGLSIYINRTLSFIGIGYQANNYYSFKCRTCHIA